MNSVENKPKGKRKHISKRLLIFPAILLGGALAYSLFQIGWHEWDRYYGRRGSRVINEEHGIHVRYFADTKSRIWNDHTQKYTSKKLLWVGEEPPRDSISVFSNSELLRGFYNTHTGEVTLPARYKHAWYFSEGVAAIVGDDDRLRFINYDGTLAIPGDYTYTKGHDYAFVNGVCPVYNDTSNRFELLRRDGNWEFGAGL